MLRYVTGSDTQAKEQARSTKTELVRQFAVHCFKSGLFEWGITYFAVSSYLATCTIEVDIWYVPH